MKKISTTIASIALSLLAVGAMAQTLNSGPNKILRPIPAHMDAIELVSLHSQKGNNQHRVANGPTHMLLDLGAADKACVGASVYFYWNPLVYINNAFTAADSGAGATKNYDGLHSITVAYDTILDAADGAHTAAKGSVVVDTIWLAMAVHNTSGTNDTLIFSIDNVAYNGYPTRTQNYSLDTAVIDNTTWNSHGNKLDSLFFIYIIPHHGLTTAIPGTAARGSHYAVTVGTLNHNSKLDTIGVANRSEGSSCTNYGYCHVRTCAGPQLGPMPNINSYESGFLFYSQAGFGGNGSVLTWPQANGRIGNSGGSFNPGDAYPSLSCNNDTMYFYYQDQYMFVSIDYNDVTGVDNIKDKSEFSVNQNYPNPFNQQTQITYNLNKPSNVVFSVFDLTGRELVKNSYTTVAPGQHVITLDANQFNPGVYFYSFNVNGNLVTKKMIITQ